MLKIAVTSPDIREMKGVGKTSGRPYHMRIQTAYAFTIDKDGVAGDFPDKFEIALEADQPPYARGHYTLSPAAVFVSRDGRLEVRPKLIPAVAVAAKAA
jgi:hypothetical protein